MVRLGWIVLVFIKFWRVPICITMATAFSFLVLRIHILCYVYLYVQYAEAKLSVAKKYAINKKSTLLHEIFSLDVARYLWL